MSACRLTTTKTRELLGSPPRGRRTQNRSPASNVGLIRENVIHLPVQGIRALIEDGQVAGFPGGSGVSRQELASRIFDDAGAASMAARGLVDRPENTFVDPDRYLESHTPRDTTS